MFQRKNQVVLERTLKNRDCPRNSPAGERKNFEKKRMDG
jgi:hypothetical protein